MSIQTILQHRATVRRATQEMIDGSPLNMWSTIAESVAVFYSKDNAEFDPTWTASQRRETDQRGTLFALAAADIKPGDRVTITRPANIGSFEILPDPSSIVAPHLVTHREFKVRSVG